MNIHEAVRILVENKNTIILGNEEAAKRDMLFNEAIDTVAEQFKPAEIELEGGGSNWWHVCGECHGPIDSSDSFCRHCGRPVKQT